MRMRNKGIIKIRFNPKRIEELDEARAKTGLWTTRNIQFNHTGKSRGTFKGIRREK